MRWLNFMIVRLMICLTENLAAKHFLPTDCRSRANVCSVKCSVTSPTYGTRVP